MLYKLMRGIRLAVGGDAQVFNGYQDNTTLLNPMYTKGLSRMAMALQTVLQTWKLRIKLHT